MHRGQPDSRVGQCLLELQFGDERAEDDSSGLAHAYGELSRLPAQNGVQTLSIKGQYQRIFPLLGCLPCKESSLRVVAGFLAFGQLHDRCTF